MLMLVRPQVANAAEEAKDPAKDLPWGIVGSLGIATLLYVLMSLCIVSGRLLAMSWQRCLLRLPRHPCHCRLPICMALVLHAMPLHTGRRHFTSSHAGHLHTPAPAGHDGPLPEH